MNAHDSTLSGDMSLLTGSCPSPRVLAEALHRFSVENGCDHLYVLLDPSLRSIQQDPRWEVVQNIYPIPPEMLTVRLQHSELSSKVWPQLMRLDLSKSRDAHVLSILVEMAVDDWTPVAQIEGRGHRIGGFIWSSVEVANLMAHLAKRILFRTSEGDTALLRLHDPAVFVHVWDIANAEQRRALFGPIQAWAALGWECEWIMFEAPEAHEMTGHPLQFAPSQWRALEHIGPLNQAWRKVVFEEELKVDISMRAVRDSLTHASIWNLHDSRDLETWAEYALRIHPNFHRHPQVQKWLAMSVDGLGLGRRLAELDASQWQDITAWCRLPNTVSPTRSTV